MYACRYIAELNVLADRLIVHELKDLALRLSVNECNMYLALRLPANLFSLDLATSPSPSTIHYAFDNLPEDHPFLQILVDHHCLTYAAVQNSVFKERVIRMPREFLFRALIKYSERKRESNRLELKDYCKN